MRSLIAVSIASLVLALAPANAAPRLTPEQKLAKALDGRVAGPPQRCINLRNIRGSQIIDRTAILYEAGSTIYVNRPDAGSESLDWSDTLVTRTSMSQLCSIDVVHLYDNVSRVQSGAVFLGEFVPYKKVRTASTR